MKICFKKIIILPLIFLLSNLPTFAQNEKGKLEVIEKVEKKSPVYEVLGRELTDKEKLSFQGVTITEQVIKDQLLPRESNLIVVRALIAIGISPSKNSLNLLSTESGKTFRELYIYLKGLKDEYGSVEKGLEERNFIENKDLILKNTIASAYKEVYGQEVEDVYKSPDQKEDLYNYFKAQNAYRYEEIKSILMENMSQEEKRKIMNTLLKKVKREDLISNEKFTSSILKQDFTYDSLDELFKQL